VLVHFLAAERAGSATAGQRRMNTPQTQSGGSLEPVGSARMSDTAIFLILLLALCAMALIAGLVNGWTIPTTN
jgi:hypothetical protein